MWTLFGIFHIIFNNYTDTLLIFVEVVGMAHAGIDNYKKTSIFLLK